MSRSSKRRRPLDHAEDGNNCHIDRHLRTIYLEGEITQAIATKFRRFVRTLERGKRPITVEINSQGGDVEAGLMIVDTITLCKRQVVTRVIGQAFSMACVIAASGDIREMLPTSYLMSHQGSYSIETTYDNLTNELRYARSVESICWSIMDSRSLKSPGYWKKKCGTKDYYMNSDTAIREGLIDRICTKG